MTITTNPDTKFVKEMWAAIRENNGENSGYQVYVQGFPRNGRGNLPLWNVYKNQRLTLVNMPVDRTSVRVQNVDTRTNWRD